LRHGQGYRVHLRPWSGGETAADAAAGAAQVNAAMEALIRECPQQYLWGYARYKQPRQENLT
jgi:Kdo2-lipid IVA lauroyltransferase/acyltransferase